MVFFLINLTILLTVITVIIILIQGAIYVPSSNKAIETIITLSEVKKGDRVADLGSGDGRIVIEFAKKGAKAIGFEINPLLVLISRINIKKNRLEGNAVIYWKSYWGTDLSKFNIVTVFGIDYIMKRLKKKLKKELKPGSKLLINIFPFPNWEYIHKENGVYLYKI